MTDCRPPAPTPADDARPRRGVRRAAAALAFAAAGLAALPPAEAKCVRSGAIYTCVEPSGPPIMMSCYGTGGVQTCFDFAGKTLLVGHHWRNQLTTTSEDAFSAATTTDGTTSDPIDTGSSTQITTSSETDFETELSTALMANAAAAKTKKPSTGTQTKAQPKH